MFVLMSLLFLIYSYFISETRMNILFFSKNYSLDLDFIYKDLEVSKSV